MMNPEHPTVWQMMAAFASDAYELRQIAPGEFELVTIEPAAKDEMSCDAVEAKLARTIETADAHE